MTTPSSPGTVVPCPALRYTIEVLVVGIDDAPLPDIALELINGDGAVIRNCTGRDGLARFNELEAGTYRLSPYALDRDAWERVEAEPIAGSTAATDGSAAVWRPRPAEESRAGFLHTVSPGECVSKLADRYGFFPQTIWDHPRNARLERLRSNKNVLYAGQGDEPGDVVYIPELRQEHMAVQTGMRYRLRRLGVPEVLRIRFVDENKPRAGIPYLLSIETVDGGPAHTCKGVTDDDGFLVEYVPPSSDRAFLVLDTEAGKEFYELGIGYLDPATTASGQADRLQNLGFDVVSETGEPDAALVSYALASLAPQSSLPVDENLVKAHLS